ncbi:hypothetical protein [Campylobacter helveticus]|uniref:hypothetical protein n=1 Tax=Campylobacter helveticus TaxID=28898 RepID=UPI0009C3BCD7|nr:hypothetical protein [Campylobacter helveticus]ARE80191.1 hypothetical protein CHELV3228_0567 [Campylobacter helveticus]TNB59889.1 hypothetical protein FDW44_01615 [Campylobacter helveticus]TXK56691.1 hypothetical protein A9726_02855 [Campylobacter helveticus]SMC18580.1 hypothetical protein SAMN02745125_00583 [Campylobacter helveticus]SUW82873.1 Uncharacterised protein [Campylobacter helveticus]
MKKSISLDIFDENGASLGKKRFYTTLDNKESINKWIKRYDDKAITEISYMCNPSPDFQHNSQLYISQKKGIEHFNFFKLFKNNLIVGAVYFSVRHCIKATWINDRDQFLAPNTKWEKDTEFHSDCLAFMLFHGQNRITSKVGINHFIPFSEKELGAAETFESHFMLEFIQGKIKISNKKKKGQQEFDFQSDELEDTFTPTKPLIFSDEAKEVLQAGKEIFKHYHEQTRDSKDYNPNAALYDIKAHFQGFNDKGKGKDRMNPPQKAQDEAYKERLSTLNYALKNLAKKIEVKVYEYEFLLE